MNFGQSRGKVVVTPELVQVEAGGQDVGIGLGSGEAIADESEAFVAHLKKLAAFFDGEMNQKGKFCFDRFQGGLDVLKIGFRELGGDVLV